VHHVVVGLLLLGLAIGLVVGPCAAVGWLVVRRRTARQAVPPAGEPAEAKDPRRLWPLLAMTAAFWLVATFVGASAGQPWWEDTLAATAVALNAVVALGYRNRRLPLNRYR
jgi:hypothetical protein